jgi:GWxTD domain-containing protein
MKPCLLALALYSGFALAYPTHAQDVSEPTPVLAKQQNAYAHEREARLARLNPHFRAWLQEDVPYIVAPEERDSFLLLKTDEERRQFIEQFWERRKPDPHGVENTFKGEHYRRILYADENFGGSTLGWKTDRGRFYIMWGEPDEIAEFPAEYDCVQGDGITVHDSPGGFRWRYRYLEGVGENVDVYFLRAKNASGKSGGNPSFSFSSEKCSFSRPVPGAAGLANMLSGDDPNLAPYSVTMIACTGFPLLTDEPSRKNDLQDLLDPHLPRYQIPMRVEFHSEAVTSITSLATVRVSIPSVDIVFPALRGLLANARMYGRMTNMTTGRIETEFSGGAWLTRTRLPYGYWTELGEKKIALGPGIYQLEIAVKDVESNMYAAESSIVLISASPPTN